MSAPAVETSSNDGPGGFLVKNRAEEKPRREVIHAWPCYSTPLLAADLQEVVDANDNVVRGNLFHGSPVLYQVAGLPNTLRDSQCHGPQLELWASRGATMLRDIVTRIVDADTPDAPEDEDNFKVARTKHANKMTRRRQSYRDRNKLGLVPGFYRTGVRTKTFAALMSRLTDDQIMLASPWQVDLTRMVMINPKNGDTEPLFRAQEVDERVREGLDVARSLSASERESLGWTNIPSPPTLAAWLAQHPQFLGYNPQDEFYTNAWYVDRRAGAFVPDSDDEEEDTGEESEADEEDLFDDDFPDLDIEAEVQPLPARDLAGASIDNTAAAAPPLEANENSEVVATQIINKRQFGSHNSDSTMSSTHPAEENHAEQPEQAEQAGHAGQAGNAEQAEHPAVPAEQPRLTKSGLISLHHLFGEGVIPPPGRFRYPVTLDEDRVIYPESTILAAERDDLPPWFIYKYRMRLTGPGPGLEHVEFYVQHPELRTKKQLLDAILGRFTLYPADRERYENNYNSLVAGTMTRKKFEQSVIHQLVVGSTFCMAMHEQLMRMFGGEAWKFVQKQGYNNEFWTGGSSLATDP